MKKIILPILIMIALMIAAPASSLARNGHGYHGQGFYGNGYRGQGYHGQGYYNHGYGHHYNHGSNFTTSFFFGAPYAFYPSPYVYYAPPPPPVVYYAPPPVYYAPPPPPSGQLFFGFTVD
jgi:hypothetical protein